MRLATNVGLLCSYASLAGCPWETATDFKSAASPSVKAACYLSVAPVILCMLAHQLQEMTAPIDKWRFS